MRSASRFLIAWCKSWHISLFEKVILVNSLMLIGEALAGLWVTSHNLEAHHYLIDTSFIVLATLVTLATNILLMRASFRPLFSLLTTIRKVSAGDTQARAAVTTSSEEIGELGQAFNSMMDRLEAVRREQTTLILQAQEEERRRIALELHDETGQNLTALLIHAELLNQNFQQIQSSAISKPAYEQLARGLQQLTTLTQLTLENVRTLAQQLRPSVLDDLGLFAALRWLQDDSGERLHLAVELDIGEIKHPLPANYETVLFRIAQESLTNIARHAHTQHACIVLQEEQQSLCLRVHDNGCGYDPQQRHAGSGTLGMRERARQLGGTLTIYSYPGQGTIVQTVLPLPDKVETEQSIQQASYKKEGRQHDHRN